MSARVERLSSLQTNPESDKQKELRESERYLKLARENPHRLTEEIKKNPKTEPLLRKILGDSEYERIKDLNPIGLSEDTSVARMQREIYAFVDIQEYTEKNGTREKFIKGLIDSIVVENSELALKIIETKGAILKDIIAQIFTYEGLKQIAEGLKTSIVHLFSGDAYKTGKSLGELGLITIGSGAGGFVLKRLGKGATQMGERVALQGGKETLISQGLQMGGKVVEGVGKVVQAPYNGVETGVKKIGGAVKSGVVAGGEALGNIPQIQRVTEAGGKLVDIGMEKLSESGQKIVNATKERTKEVLAMVSLPILVGSKDGAEEAGRLRGQIGAVGDVGKIKPGFQEKPKGALGFDISKNEIYSEFPFLQKHAEFLGELKPSDILGQGVNAIVVRHPNKPDTVVKIAKEGKVDDLGKEFDLAQQFYMTLKEGKKKYQGQLSENVHVVKVSEDPRNTGGYFLMQRVDGQNLNTIFYREYYNEALGRKYTKGHLDSLTDAQFDTLMKKDGLYKISPHTLAENDFEGRLLRGAMDRFYHAQLANTELGNTLSFLEWSGYHHNDFQMNPGNIMVDKERQMYIIDFGKATIDPKVKKIDIGQALILFYNPIEKIYPLMV